MKNKGKINVRGNFMKKINKLMATLLIGVVGVMGIGTVYADEPNANGNGSNASGSNNASDIAGSLVTVDCNSTKLAVGASTLCTVNVKPTAALAASTTTKSVIIKASQSKYLTMSEINVNNGFTLVSEDIKDKTKENTIVLTYSGSGLKANEKNPIFSFNLKLEDAAANIKDGDCGQICITGAVFDSDTVKVGDDGKACPNIIITKQTCEGKDCNPQTGAFMNYAVIAGVASVALITIVISTRKKKFYTV